MASQVETGINAALGEINAKLTEFLPEQEGWADWLRLNLEEHTRQEIQNIKAKYDRRINLLLQYRDVLEGTLDALLQDGHPDLPVFDIDLSSLEDLRRNEATQAAALKKVKSDTAATFTATSGTAVPKS